MNREVFGGYTDNLVAMRLPVDAVRARDITADISAHMITIDGMNYIQVHPTFLYESLWNLFILCLMLVYHKHKKFQGEIWFLYLGGYGIGRFWIEGIRTDQLYLTGTTIPVSQVVAIICIVAAVAADLTVRLRLNKKREQSADNS